MCGLFKKLKKAFKKKKTRRIPSNFIVKEKEKKLLYDRIMAIKRQYAFFPEGVRKELSYQEVFDKMKELSILPKSWNDSATIQKFLTRYNSRNELDFIPFEAIGEEVKGNYFIKIIRSYLDRVKIGDNEKMKIFWSTSTDEERRGFLIDLAENCIKEGISVSDVSQYICNRLNNELGYLSDDTIREYLPQKFKNQTKVWAKEGITFEKTGQETKEIKKLKYIAGKKYEKMERDLLKCKKEKIELELKFLKDELKSKSKSELRRKKLKKSRKKTKKKKKSRKKRRRSAIIAKNKKHK